MASNRRSIAVSRAAALRSAQAWTQAQQRRLSHSSHQGHLRLTSSNFFDWFSTVFTPFRLELELDEADTRLGQIEAVGPRFLLGLAEVQLGVGDLGPPQGPAGVVPAAPNLLRLQAVTMW